MIYKTCVKCRARSKITNKTYSEKHTEKAKKTKEHYEAHKEEAKEHNNQYREKHDDRLKEYDRAREQINIYCPHCNGEIVKKKVEQSSTVAEM